MDHIDIFAKFLELYPEFQDKILNWAPSKDNSIRMMIRNNGGTFEFTYIDDKHHELILKSPYPKPDKSKLLKIFIVLVVAAFLAVIFWNVAKVVEHLEPTEPTEPSIGMSVVESTEPTFTTAPIEPTIIPTETISEPTETEPMEVPSENPSEPETEPTRKYYNVPLSEDLQDHIFTECEKRNVDPALVIAMIRKESNYNANSVGDSGNSLGLMQIQPRWHQATMNSLNCPDLMDPYQNVTVGIYIISGHLSVGKGEAYALMAYNMGGYYAGKNFNKGVITSYAKTVLAYRDDLTWKE